MPDSHDVFDAERQLTAMAAMAQLPRAGGKRYAVLFRHGSLQLQVFAPRGRDTQRPHTRDEIYVVIKGSGSYVCGGTRVAFKQGDVLFAAAGEEHRFEDFTEDFFTWVFFYGPEGGELPAPQAAPAVPAP
jgi:mannose-6-phosphate isomerase-like protein (cupin superfamily)